MRIAQLLLAFFIVVYSTQSFSQLKPEVNLVEGGNSQIRETIAGTVEQSLLTINRLAHDKGSIEELSEYYTRSGLKELRQLVENYRIYAFARDYATVLLESNKAGSEYEVRGIEVVTLNGEQKHEIKRIRFKLNERMVISSVDFIQEKYNYEDLMLLKPKTDISKSRQKMVAEKIEEFRTAYESKDVDFFRNIIHDEALIVVGVKKNPLSDPEREWHNLLEGKESRLIRRTKAEYIKKLSTVFDINSWVYVKFDSIKIEQHRKIPELYGIQLYQSWLSQSYSDTGYVFIIMDFKEEENPQMHVRAWQEKKKNLSRYKWTLRDFHIIP